MKQDFRVNGYASYDYDNPENYETPQGVSMTNPNMHVPLRDMLERFSTGMTVPKLDALYQFEDVNGETEVTQLELVDIRMMSEVEKAELRFKLKENIQEQRQALQNRKKRNDERKRRRLENTKILDFFRLNYKTEDGEENP